MITLDFPPPTYGVGPGLDFAVTLSGFTVLADDTLDGGINTFGAVPSDWDLYDLFFTTVPDTSGSYVLQFNHSQRAPWPIGSPVRITINWSRAGGAPVDSLSVTDRVWDPVSGLSAVLSGDSPILIEIRDAVVTAAATNMP